MLGFWSRLSKTGYVNFEHIMAGIGSPALIFTIFMLIGIVLRNFYKITHTIPYFKVSLVSSVAYLIVSILSEFFKDTNRGNQFYADIIGIAIYLVINYLLYKKNKLYS